MRTISRSSLIEHTEGIPIRMSSSWYLWRISALGTGGDYVPSESSSGHWLRRLSSEELPRVSATCCKRAKRSPVGSADWTSGAASLACQPAGLLRPRRKALTISSAPTAFFGCARAPSHRPGLKDSCRYPACAPEGTGRAALGSTLGHSWQAPVPPRARALRTTLEGRNRYREERIRFLYRPQICPAAD